MREKKLCDNNVRGNNVVQFLELAKSTSEEEAKRYKIRRGFEKHVRRHRKSKIGISVGLVNNFT